MMEPTALLLAKLPGLAAREWATRKVRIAKEAEVLSKRLDAQRSMQQRAVVARIDDKISDSDFEGLKRSMAEETFRIEAQIAELDREKSTFEELTKQANAQVSTLRRLGRRLAPGRGRNFSGHSSQKAFRTIPKRGSLHQRMSLWFNYLTTFLTPSVTLASPTGFEPVLPP